MGKSEQKMKEQWVTLKNYFMREGEIVQLLGSNKIKIEQLREHILNRSLYLGWMDTKTQLHSNFLETIL